MSPVSNYVWFVCFLLLLIFSVCIFLSFCLFITSNIQPKIQNPLFLPNKNGKQQPRATKRRKGRRREHSPVSFFSFFLSFLTAMFFLFSQLYKVSFLPLICSICTISLITSDIYTYSKILSFTIQEWEAATPKQKKGRRKRRRCEASLVSFFFIH